MKARKAMLTALLVQAVLVATTVLAAQGLPATPAQAQELPGVCNGRSDAGLLINAGTTGRPARAPQYLVNVHTDAVGDPSGVLLLRTDTSRLQATDFCRAWRHLPGQPPGGGCEDSHQEGDVVAHAVGFGRFADGRTVLVRTDVRDTAAGISFRLRYRPLEDVAGTGPLDHECEEGRWTGVPAEGWLPLDRMQVRVLPSST